MPVKIICSVSLTAWLVLAHVVSAQSLDVESLVRNLQAGGFVIVMRHAKSPRQAPDTDTANPDNYNGERQLDETGRKDAIAMGTALKNLGIQITEIESSPAYRTLETARLAGFSEVRIREYLGNQGMQASSEFFAVRLRENLAHAPGQGNRLVITHSPNIAAAFPDLDPEVEQGEALVFDPQVSTIAPVARIRITVWPNLE